MHFGDVLNAEPDNRLAQNYLDKSAPKMKMGIRLEMPIFSCRSPEHALGCPTEATLTSLTRHNVLIYRTQVLIRPYVLSR